MLSNLQELLERSIFHSIREITVAEGYLPDIKDYDIENTNLTEATLAKEQFELAKVNIVNNMGFVVDIFSSGNNQAKGIKKVPRIVIDTVSYLPGIMGGDTTPVYTNINGVYVKTKNASVTSDLTFNVYVVSNTIKQARILNAIISRALPRRGYIKTYLNSTIEFSGNIFIKFMMHGDSNDLAEGIIESYFNYEAPDIFENLPETIPTIVNGQPFNIVPISEIDSTTLFTINN